MTASDMVIGRFYFLVPNKAPRFVCGGQQSGLVGNKSIIYFEAWPDSPFLISPNIEVTPAPSK